jgi:acetolactate synthase-1/2/3 large subunit
MAQARRCALLLGGEACQPRGLEAASRLQAIGYEVFADTFVGRLARGAGTFAPKRVPYAAESALEALHGIDLIVLCGTTEPVAFFAYPNRPSSLVPEGCRTMVLASRSERAVVALELLADALNAPARGPTQALRRPDMPSGPVTPKSIGASVARHLPEGALVCNDGVTSGAAVMAGTAEAAPHEVFDLTGGAIGIGLPLAIGVAIGAPGRKVLSLNGDGASMYNIQSLWTMARENLDVTAVIFANYAYRILDIEMERTGSGRAGPSARRLLDLGDPKIDFVSLAKGFGVASASCSSAEDFEKVFAHAMHQTGPMLIEARI